MKYTKPIAAIASALALAATLTACGGTAPGASTPPPGPSSSATTEPAPGDTKVVIGVKFDQPGLGLKDGDTNTGFDVEVAKYVAGKLGYTDIEFKESPSAQRETLIESDQVKMVFATYSITDARKEKISFAGPYFLAGQDLLVLATNTDITGPETLGGKQLCSVTGSTSAQKLKDKYPEVQLQEYDTYSKCVEALASGTIDAVTTDDVILAGFAAQTQYAGKLKVVGAPFSEERYGVGIKKGDVELCTKINEALAEMVTSGAWQEALDKTVGPSGFKASAANPPATDACS